MTPPFELLIAPSKRALRLLLGEQMIGVINYIRVSAGVAGGLGPEIRRDAAVSHAFNGQRLRQALFTALMSKLRPQAIVETGTYLGTTTAFMAQTGLPVFTIEANSRFYGFARARFFGSGTIKLFYGDSRAALCRILDGPLRELNPHLLFFYLDAHWNDDLPLVEEIDIVFTRCPSAVTMIDDFQVPDDPGYSYDSWGPGKSLVPDYIAPAVIAHGLETFYPSASSAQESGWRKGCVILAKDKAQITLLASLSLLRHGRKPELS
jgi:hypothetical protein